MISTSQLLCLLLLSRISAEIVYPTVGGYDITTLVSAAVAEALRFTVALPFILYSIRGNDMYAAITRKSRIAGWIFAAAAAFLISFAAARCALFSAEYAQRTVLSGMSGGVITILIGVFAVYCATRGAEGIARGGVLILAGAALLTLIIALSTLQHIRPPELGTKPYSKDLISQVYERMMRGGEYLMFAALLPCTRRKKGSIAPAGTAVIFALSSLCIVVLINLFSMAVLGEFFGIADNPLTDIAQLSDIVLFKRLDGFAGALWSVAAAIRCGAFLFSAYAFFRSVTTARKGASYEKITDSHASGRHSAA